MCLLGFRRVWGLSRKIGPGKNSPARPILDNKTGPGGPILVDHFWWYPKLVRPDQNRSGPSNARASVPHPQEQQSMTETG